MKVEVSVTRHVEIVYTFEVDDSLDELEIEDLIKARRVKPLSKVECDPEYGSTSFKFFGKTDSE